MSAAERSRATKCAVVLRRVRISSSCFKAHRLLYLVSMFKAHRLLYLSPQGLRLIKKEESDAPRAALFAFTLSCWLYAKLSNDSIYSYPRQ